MIASGELIKARTDVVFGVCCFFLSSLQFVVSYAVHSFARLPIAFRGGGDCGMEAKKNHVYTTRQAATTLPLPRLRDRDAQAIKIKAHGLRRDCKGRKLPKRRRCKCRGENMSEANERERERDRKEER